jgi:hypothetical protein
MSDIALERPNVASVEVEESRDVPVGLIVLCAALLFIAGYGLGNVIEPKQPVAWGAFLGGFASGFFLAVYLIFAPGRVEVAEFHAQADEQTTPRAVPFVTGEDVRQVSIIRPSQTVRTLDGKFSHTFHGKKLDKMLSWVHEGDTRIRRDGSPEGHGMIEAGVSTSAYPYVVRAMRDMGLIERDGNEWTEKGIGWLEVDLPPTPDMQ